MLVHNEKGNHKKNEKTTYRMGENICKQHDQQGLNFQTAHTTQQQKNQTQLKNGQKNKHFSRQENGLLAIYTNEKMLNIENCSVQLLSHI